jgi:hypothetical protein
LFQRLRALFFVNIVILETYSGKIIEKILRGGSSSVHIA